MKTNRSIVNVDSDGLFDIEKSVQEYRILEFLDFLTQFEDLDYRPSGQSLREEIYKSWINDGRKGTQKIPEDAYRLAKAVVILKILSARMSANLSEEEYIKLGKRMLLMIENKQKTIQSLYEGLTVH